MQKQRREDENTERGGKTMHRLEIIEFSTTKSSSQCGFASSADGCTEQPVLRERGGKG